MVCERAMYEGPAASGVLTIGHDSVGSPRAGSSGYCQRAPPWAASPPMLVLNPNSDPVTITMTFQTEHGEVPGPDRDPGPLVPQDLRGERLRPGHLRRSTRVTSVGGPIVCERSVYWRFPGAKLDYLGTDSIGYSP